MIKFSAIIKYSNARIVSGKIIPIYDEYKAGIVFSSPKNQVTGKFYFGGNNVLQYGNEAEVYIVIALDHLIKEYVFIGNKFTFYEGNILIGEGIVKGHIQTVT